MRAQPTPKVTRDDVERVVRREYPAERVADVLSMLDEYGGESWHREPVRVHLAVLKLAAGEIEAVRRELETAKTDFRDVIVPAEYPLYERAGFASSEGRVTPDVERRIVEADAKQYADWLRGRAPEEDAPP